MLPILVQLLSFVAGRYVEEHGGTSVRELRNSTPKFSLRLLDSRFAYRTPPNSCNPGSQGPDPSWCAPHGTGAAEWVLSVAAERLRFDETQRTIRSMVWVLSVEEASQMEIV
jgi:hypothetical protein